MRIETLSIFPQMFTEAMNTSIIGRARRAGLLEFCAHDLRKWTHDNHNTTDDEIYGGGAGQLMKVEPIFEALDELTGTCKREGVFCEPPDVCKPQDAYEPHNTPHKLTEDVRGVQAAPKVIFFTPTGQVFNQELAVALSKESHLIMVCGRYEGFDERVYTRADICLSLGDYVLTGGELAAMVVTDAICRNIDGVLGDARSVVDESFSAGLLEYPQYTRPASYRGLDVPEVLLSGNHRLIEQWRRKQSIIKTATFRPDLLQTAELTQDELKMIDELWRKQ